MKHSLEDLSARSRRGDLSEAEQKQLGLALDASLEARLSHRAGVEFDAEDSVLAGDDALAQRVTERLLENQPVSKPRRRHVWRLAAAGVCLTVAAAAGPPVVQRARHFVLELGSFGFDTPSSAPAPARPPAKPKAVRGKSPRPKAVLPAPPPEPKVETVPVAPPAKAASAQKKVRSAGAVEQAEPEESGAAVAFREASRLRREGKTAAAIDRYSSLLGRYPNSSEARASEIALGMLHLRGGSPAAGLSYFERYLSVNPGGQLAADALWGKTQALAALGRSEEARRGLELLIDRYPRSTYATAARAKLGISP